MKICGGISGIEYTRFPAITTTMLEEFIRRKVDAILEDQDINQPHEVYCYPQILGDTRGGIKYATMAIGMSGVTEEKDTLYNRIKQFSYRPRINRGIQNAIVKAYEYNEEKLRMFLENPKYLKHLALSPKDIDFLYTNRKLQVYSVQGSPCYIFQADMDRILDDFLMDAESDDPIIPNYTTIGIKALGDKLDSPLSYDILVTSDPIAEMDNAAMVFKALVAR